MGIGAGLIYVPILAVQSHHWRLHRALALGTVMTGISSSTLAITQYVINNILHSGSSLGGVIFPIMLNQLFNGSVGFAWGVRASAFLILGMLVLANILMSTNKTLMSLEKPHPDVKGILKDVPNQLGNFA